MAKTATLQTLLNPLSTYLSTASVDSLMNGKLEETHAFHEVLPIPL